RPPAIRPARKPSPWLFISCPLRSSRRGESDSDSKGNPYGQPETDVVRRHTDGCAYPRAKTGPQPHSHAPVALSHLTPGVKQNDWARRDPADRPFAYVQAPIEFRSESRISWKLRYHPLRGKTWGGMSS